MKSCRFTDRFRLLSSRNEKAFIPFTVLGYPDPDTCVSTVAAMIESGASALELGIPFSDPVADGPVIQTAIHQTLASGVSVSTVMETLKRIRLLDKSIPISLLTYTNIILARGKRRFFEEASASGADAITVADMPLEEFDELETCYRESDLAPVMIVSPLTPPQRVEAIVRKAKGFIYLVSRAGITGLDDRYQENLQQSIAAIRHLTKLPVYVGFGISTADQAAGMIAAGADGVITGSKIIDIIGQTPASNRIQTLKQYVSSMALAIADDISSRAPEQLVEAR